MGIYFKRHSIRKPGYNYSRDGAYFVTVCTYKMQCIFGSISNGKCLPSRIGSIVEECWNQIPDHHSESSLDAFVLMPNHIHGIIRILTKDITQKEMDNIRKTVATGPVKGSIGAMIGQFKSAVSRQSSTPLVWQRNYYDHIIRNEREYNLIRLYIAANPVIWDNDPDNPARTTGINDEILKQCGFCEEDFDLIRNYLEYRKSRFY